MPPSADNGAAGRVFRQDSRPGTSPESWRGFWFSIVRILVLEVVVLIALCAAFVAYLNWSSEVTFAEFLSAAVTAPSHSSPQVIKAHSPCERGA